MPNYCKTCQFYRTGHDGPMCYKGRIKPVSPLSTGDCWEPVTEQPEILTKVCSRCGRELPIESFGRHPKTRDGYQPVCRECRSEEMKGKAQGTMFERKMRKEAEAEKPKIQKPKGRPKKAEQTTEPEPKPSAAQRAIVVITDDELIAELRRRGWTGTITQTITKTQTL